MFASGCPRKMGLNCESVLLSVALLGLPAHCQLFHRFSHETYLRHKQSISQLHQRVKKSESKRWKEPAKTSLKRKKGMNAPKGLFVSCVVLPCCDLLGDTHHEIGLVRNRNLPSGFFESRGAYTESLPSFLPPLYSHPPSSLPTPSSVLFATTTPKCLHQQHTGVLWKKPVVTR